MSDYDAFLDKCVDEYYEDAEEDVLDDWDWKIDVYVEQQENLYDGYE